MLKDTANPRPRSASLESYLAKRGRRSSIDQIAHEIINQLTVLNLVSARIIARFPADTELGRDAEIFERSIIDATALVQQLAKDLQAHEDFGHQEGRNATPIPGQLLRFLRRVPGHKR